MRRYSLVHVTSYDGESFDELREKLDGEYVKYIDANSLELDAIRYRWLRKQYAIGAETYIAESITNEVELDAHIDTAIGR